MGCGAETCGSHDHASGLPGKDHLCGEFLLLQIAFHRIVAKTGAVFGKIGQRVVRLAHQQKLTIIQPRYFAHSLSLSLEPDFGSFA